MGPSDLSSSTHAPLKLLHLLRLYRSAGGDQEKETQIIEDILGSWENIAPVFIAILRWSDAGFKKDPCWLELSFPDRLALVWAHATRITDILISKKVDLTIAAKLFSANLPERPVTQMMWLDPYYQISVANTDLIEESNLLFHGLGYAFNSDDIGKSISSVQAEKICSVMTLEIDGDRVISPWLAAYFDSSCHSFDTIFSCRPKGIFKAASDPSLEACKQVVGNFLSTLEQDLDIASSWFAVWWFGRFGLNELEKSRLNSAIEKVDFVLLSQHKDADADAFVLAVVGNCCVRLGGGDARHAITNQVKNMATFYSTKFPDQRAWIDQSDDNEAVNALKQLLECVASISQSDNISESFQKFSEIIEEIATIWTSAAPELRRVIENILKSIDAKHSKDLWRSLVRLRSL